MSRDAQSSSGDIVQRAVRTQVTDAVLAAKKDDGSANSGKFRVTAFTPRIIAANVLTSAAIGLSVAVPVSIIDYSIMAKVAGLAPSIRAGLVDGFKTLLLRPHKFFLPCRENQRSIVFGVVATVYAATYLSSDLVKCWMEANGHGDEATDWARGITSGVTNTIFTIWKDSFILRKLPQAPDAPKGKPYVPFVSRFGFCVRDMITCIAAFTLVPMFARWLDEHYGGPMTNVLGNSKVSALTVPAAMQFITTSIHISSIRYQRTYPNPSLLDVTSALRADYVGATTARIGRIIPAFGIGSIGNTTLLDLTTRCAAAHDRKRACGDQQ